MGNPEEILIGTSSEIAVQPLREVPKRTSFEISIEHLLEIWRRTLGTILGQPLEEIPARTPSVISIPVCKYMFQQSIRDRQMNKQCMT